MNVSNLRELLLFTLILAEAGAIQSGRFLGGHREFQNRCMVNVGNSSNNNPAGLDPDVVNAMKRVYTLQYAGIDEQTGHVADPLLSPTRCLVSLGQDNVDTRHVGLGVGFSECPNAVQLDKYGKPTGKVKAPPWSQLFQLGLDGRFYHCGTGLCLRRVPCGSVHVYDLGDCESQGLAKFETWKAVANQADKLVRIGVPLAGAVGVCQTCGPFLLMQKCRGEGDCDRIPPPPKTGWTKNCSHAPHDHRQSDPVHIQPGPLSTTACGTGLGEDPAGPTWGDPLGKGHRSFWYFHKYGEHPGYE